MTSLSAPDRLPRESRRIITVLVFSAFVMLLNETTLGVALRSIMGDFGIDADTAQWLLTGFMLTTAIVLPATGWILGRFETRWVFGAAVGLFFLGTVVAALAPSFAVLLAGRVAQAAGTALSMPLLTTVAMAIIPVHRRGGVMGIISVVMAVGPALGPTVAGLILQWSSWHAIFWVMVPLVAVAGIAGVLTLREVGERVDAPLDVASVVLSAVAFGGSVYGLSSLGRILDGDWASAAVLGAGLVGIAAFVRRQRRLGSGALLDLRPLAVRNFAASLVALVILVGVMLGVLNTLPLYLQGSLMATTAVAGLALLPGGLAETVLSPIVGRLYDRVGPRPLLVPGMAIAVGALFGFATLDEGSSVTTVIVLHTMFSVGLAGIFTPIMATALGSLPSKLYAHGSAILNTLQQLAGAAGTAGLIAIFSRVSGGNDGPEAIADGATAAFLVGAVACLGALAASVLTRRVDADS